VFLFGLDSWEFPLMVAAHVSEILQGGFIGYFLFTAVKKASDKI
jgi:hypothetical protein